MCFLPHVSPPKHIPLSEEIQSENLTSSQLKLSKAGCEIDTAQLV